MKFIEIFWLLAIFLAIIAIFSILPFEIAFNAIAISLAIFALIWIHIARKSLSKGSSLRQFASLLFLCLLFLLLFSIWQFSSKIFPLEEWPSYIFLGITFLLLVASSYKLMKIGKEFGFSVEAKRIEKLKKK